MAGHRPTDWHVLDLDKDPTPGDPERIRHLAKTLHDFADDVSDALRLVKGMSDEDTLLEWAGKSAEVFKDEFGDVPKNLRKLKKSYSMCGDALSDFWPKLERAQALADKALVRARAAQDDLSAANSRLVSADSWVTRATREADKYKDDPTGSKSDGDKPDAAKVRTATRDAQHAHSAQTLARSDVNDAQDALDAAKKMAADARKMREGAAREAKSKIDEASDAGIQNRSWWEEVTDWVGDNWDNIVAVAKVVVTVVGIVAMIIGGPILGAILLVAAAVLLADTLYKYSRGQASLWDVTLAALDCLPGGRGLTTLGGLAKGLKGGLAALKGMKAGLKTMGLALRGLGKNARDMVLDGVEGAYKRTKYAVRHRGSDPVDMATGAMFLPLTDVELPGLLPLIITRRAASDYRCGWWFGPSWASSIDQRLEVDEDGVVFVTEDGLLLTYPHPSGTHLPVMNDEGPRWPLTRLEDGDYRIDDPVTGQARHFRRPTADGVALLARITDRNDHTITFDHDEQGAPLALRHSGGYHLKLTTDEGRVTSLSLAGAAEDGTDVVIKRYGYTDGNLTETINSSDLPLRLAYDHRLRITSWTDTNDRSYFYTYDADDRCVAEGGEAGHIAITLDYDGTDPAWPECRITTLTTAEGAVTRFVVHGNSQVVAEIDPLGAVTRTAYDGHHHVLSETDALGHITRTDRDEYGRPTVSVRPDGRVARVEYDELALPTVMVGFDGRTHRWTYDERGNCTSMTGAASGTVHFTYDSEGRRTSVTDALGHTTAIRCDRAGLPIEVVDPVGAVTRYDRDPFGRPVVITDAAAAVNRLDWTVEGRPARRTAPDGTTESWTYDGEGNCTSHTDQLGGVTHFEYTHFDMPASRTGPDGVRHEFVHDSALRLVQVTNPQGLTWTYDYDPAGNLIAETDFDDRTIAYGHDATGRVVSRTNALGQTVTFERDALGRTVRKDAAGRVTTFAYDATDQLVRAAGPDATLTLVRDHRGLLRAETVNGHTMAYEYDAAGRRTSRTTPSGVRSTYEYDAAGSRVGLVTAGRSIDFSYDLVGREVSRRIGGALKLDQVYDPLGRLTSQTLKDMEGGRLQSRAYRYRGDGNVVGVDDSLLGGRSFELSASGRVVAVHAADWSERYAYDEAGNQTAADWPTTQPGQDVMGTRHYEGTRVTSAGRVSYEHDGLGRLVVRRKAGLSRKPGVWRYTWDAEDRLTYAITPDGTHWQYLYDPLGRRTAKVRLSVDGDTVEERVDFAWDGGTLCEQTTTAPEFPNPVTLTWDHQGLHPVAQTERITAAGASQTEIDSRFYAIVTDLIGTPTELVDEQGEIAWHARRTVWGTTAWPRTSQTYTPLRFPGQYYDPETGLHYNYFRYYDPETARYLSPDPLGLGPSPNPVSYVETPHTVADPAGLAPCRPLPVIGRISDTDMLADVERFEVLKIRRWSPGRNDAWIQKIIKNGRDVYLVSPIEGNLKNRRGGPTVLSRELDQLLDAGYFHEGNYLRAPR
ncbi:DUF6531 domain-containing protein [Streptomyces sp. NBC_00028]|uniref:RHS repeat-associated core domain-containing protein n=1 Tax=Streptomyces sp. NBC_00028 TaxID=2975624 RepID=UPI003252D8E8